jgi:uncharacterized membrane protein
MKSNGYTINTYWLLVASILLLSYGLRVSGLTSESLWIDEGYSLALATHSIKEIVQGTAADQHPPLYYMLLHFWLLQNQSVFFLRYFSVLIGVLGVAGAILFGCSLLNRKIGLLTGFFLACSPMHIWYSQEARMYILLSVEVTFSVYSLWRLINSSSRFYFYIYLLSALGALYTHYFAGFVIIFENLIVLCWALKSKRNFLGKWASIQGMIFIAFAPWLPIALYQALYHQMKWIPPLTIETVLSTLVLMVYGDSYRQVPSLAFIIGEVLFIVGIIQGLWRALNNKKQHFPFLFVGLWFTLPLSTIAVISQKYPIFQPKQMLFLVLPLLMLIAGALVELPMVQRWITLGVMSVFIIISLANFYTLNTKHEWREAAIYIERSCQPGDLLYFNPAAGALVFKVYFKGLFPIDGYPPGYDVVKGGWEGNSVTPEIAHKVMSSFSAQYKRVWLIEFNPHFWDPGGFLATWLGQHGQLIVDQQFRGIRVRLYDFKLEFRQRLPNLTRGQVGDFSVTQSYLNGLCGGFCR